MPSIVCSKPCSAIVVRQRRRLPRIRGQPLADDLGLIVGAAAADQPANQLRRRRPSIPARRRAACRARPETRRAPRPAPTCGESRRAGSRAAQSGCVQPLRRPARRMIVVGHQLALRHVFLRDAARRPSCCDRACAACRRSKDAGSSRCADQPLRLRPFSGAGRTDENYPHRSSRPREYGRPRQR